MEILFLASLAPSCLNWKLYYGSQFCDGFCKDINVFYVHIVIHGRYSFGQVHLKTMHVQSSTDCMLIYAMACQYSIANQ